MWIEVYLFFVVFTSTMRARKSANTLDISTPGDIILGGLFPVHKEGNKENICGEFNEIPGYQYMEAMRFAVERINNQTDLLPGIKLGTIIYDTCRSPTICADRTKDFIQLTIKEPATVQLAGIIGPFVSGNSKIVGSFLRVFEIPQISYASLSVELSNKNIYNYFFRTVPPDSFFAEALAQLLERLRWNYVSLIYSKGTYSETGAQEVMKAFSKRKICLAKKHRLARFPEEADYDRAIAEAASVSEAANVVVFVTIQRDSRRLLMAKKRQPQAKRLFIVGSIAWSNRDDITKDLGPIADGTITFAHRESNNTDFEKYFRSLTLSSYKASYKGWFRKFWQKHFNCSLRTNSTGSSEFKYHSPCTGNESLLTTHMEIAPVRVVINAVNAMAYALHDMQQYLCPNSKELCDAMKPLERPLLQKFLKNVSFPDSSYGWFIKFDQFNEVEGNYTVLNFRESRTVEHAGGSQPRVYSYEPVGEWMGHIAGDGEISGEFDIDLSKIRWVNENGTKPSSICSSACSPKHRTVPRKGPARECCWSCEPCESNDIITNNTCRTCEVGYVPNQRLKTCSKLPLKHVDEDSALAVAMIVASVVGIITDISVAALFFVKRHKSLIKASGREMCNIMLFGICVIFLVPITSLEKPTAGLCYFGRFLMGVSYTICYAPLLMKVWRIYRIFKATNEMRRTSGLIGLRSQLLITLGLIAIQALFFVVISSTNPPDLVEKFYADRGELHLECYITSPVFIAYLSYNVVLMVLCTVYAFLTRHFPKNFNEAMYIGVTMYLTCVVWVVFLASFLNVHDSISRVYWICGASVVIGWITLLGLFAPKVYQVFTKSNVDENALITWRNSMILKRIVSTDEEPASPGPGVVTPNPMVVQGIEKLQLSIPKRLLSVSDRDSKI